MKILQICSKVPYPPKDGGTLGVYAYSKALSDAGHQIKILAANPPKHFINTGENANEDGIEIIGIPVDTEPKTVRFINNIFFSTIPYQVERFYTNQFAEILSGLLLRYDPDIIQIEGLQLFCYYPFIKKNK